MTLADIHGKLEGSKLTDRAEDLLTSNIFGCIRYIPYDRILIPFLKKALSLTGANLAIPNSIRTIFYSFWPSMNCIGHAACEPDVILGIETENNEFHIYGIWQCNKSTN
jgi:hypothetical protein